MKVAYDMSASVSLAALIHRAIAVHSYVFGQVSVVNPWISWFEKIGDAIKQSIQTNHMEGAQVVLWQSLT